MSKLLFYWTTLDGDEQVYEMFAHASRNVRVVAELVCETAQEALTPGVHRIAISCVRGDGSAYVVWTGDVTVGGLQCATA